MKVASYTAAGTYVINDNSLPENLILFRSASTVQISRLIVSVAGVGVIADVNESAIRALTNNANLHTVTNNAQSYFILPLADGYHGGKRTTIEITYTGTGSIDVYYNSLQEGSMYISTKREKIFANQPAKFNKFAQLTILTEEIDYNDQINVTMQNGTRHNGTVREFQVMNTKMSGSNMENIEKYLVIDNDGMEYSEVEVISSSDTEAFVTSYLIVDEAAVEKKIAKLNAKAMEG